MKYTKAIITFYGENDLPDKENQVEISNVMLSAISVDDMSITLTGDKIVMGELREE